jgi:hypothetical protein
MDTMLDAGPVAITLLGATARPELGEGAPPGGRQYDLTSEDRSYLGGAPCPTIGAGCAASHFVAIAGWIIPNAA